MRFTAKNKTAFILSSGIHDSTVGAETQRRSIVVSGVKMTHAVVFSNNQFLWN